MDGGGRVGDGRPRQPEHLGGEPVAELGVAVLDAEGIGELRPGERVLVRPASATEHGDARGATGVERLTDESTRRVEGGVPRGGRESGLAADERLGRGARRT